MKKTGYFTLPGEAGHEDLTLELAERWGADAIRDSDGTVLSEKITSADYNIYSTICLVRADNEWAKANRNRLQQNFLMSFPLTAKSCTIEIDLLNNFFREQFEVNFNDDPKAWWQVFDRTTNKEVDTKDWQYDRERESVTINNTIPWHKYTVNFLAYRIWEEISMYNHITNNWGDREHQMPVDPIYPETQDFMLGYLQKWLDEHPKTKIVRFTSLFYNFAWFWGDTAHQRFNYGDWGSYEMTVSPYAIELFAKAKGYKMCSEDFVNKGSYCTSHNVPSEKLLDWMDFINEFVVSFGQQCIELIHKAGKVAYMFYDDHWVGTEPYGERFIDLKFDGLIKCVFNAFEARLCAGVKGVEIKELRLHPYLFPTGLGSEPTFMKGGNPALDAKRFWANIRRGLLRETIDRIGLGGYLHLVKEFPDFVEAIDEIANEFRCLKQFHADGRPYTAPLKVAVLTAWGSLRSWVYAGHFIHGMAIYEVTESLAGLPVDVTYISFKDILENGIPEDVDVILNAGQEGTAWSGGQHWKNAQVVETITQWVANGGGFIGIGEPSAAHYSSQYFQLSNVLGVDRETGSTLSNVKLACAPNNEDEFILSDQKGEIDLGNETKSVYPISRNTKVLAVKDNSVQIALNRFGKGNAVYFSGFEFNAANTRLLHRSLFQAADKSNGYGSWTSSNVFTDCAYYPQTKKLVVINSSNNTESTNIQDINGKLHTLSIEPHGLKIVDI